jgi:peptidoglycan/xylan/chitin deacetylase (PgdA/CDA1 family)
MYHRVAVIAADPWQLAVGPERFESQLRVLREHVDFVPLASLRDQLRVGRRARPVVAVTFDDGHLDNLENAKPVLDRYEVPATVFVTTGWTGRNEGFWWDRLAQVLLSPRPLPEQLGVAWGTRHFSWSDRALSDPGNRGARARWRLHDALWRELRESTEPDRNQAIAALADWAGLEGLRSDAGRPMNEGELRQLAADGLVDIGAHSISHPRLSSLSAEEKAREIHESRDRCASVLGRAPVAFAYPFGAHDPECVERVREAGFRIAVTTREELCWQPDEPLLTSRIAVTDLDGDRLLARLRWLWLP